MLDCMKLKGRMREKGYTQAEMARVLGMDQSTLNRKINDCTGKALSIQEAVMIKEVLEIEKPEEYFFLLVTCENASEK